jgi:hypothetical protein
LAGEENSCGADHYADKQQQRFHFIAPLICGLKDLVPLCLLLTQSGHSPPIYSDAQADINNVGETV